MKIFVFCNSCVPEWHVIAALAEDGHFIADHVCSHHGFIPHDMGFTSDWKHDKYNAHFPAGWELVMVDGNPKDHAGLMAAYELNKKLGGAEAG